MSSISAILQTALFAGFLTVACTAPESPESQAVTSAWPDLRGDYLGQPFPETVPRIFAPGLVSTGLDELNLAWTPDADAFFFSLRSPFHPPYILLVSRRDGVWTAPEIPPFVTGHGEVDPAFAPDGKSVFFCSRASKSDPESAREDYDLWAVERTGRGWGEARPLGDEVNSDRHDFFPTVTAAGVLYFNSQREGPGTNNIYRAVRSGGAFAPAEKLPAPVNTDSREFDPFIAPDGSYLLFASNRPGGLGGADLYISFRAEDDGWTEPINLGSPINSDTSDFSPMPSPDGRYLFFTSRRLSAERPSRKGSYAELVETLDSPGNGWGDVYWVDAAIIEDLRPGP